jgi:hypothetical protein
MRIMKKKFTLSNYVDYDFSLIGICSQEEDFKLCFFLNQALQLDFERIRDIEILLPKQGNLVSFSCFEYTDLDSDLSWYLIANRHPASNLLPDQKQTDYLLRIVGEQELIDTTQLVNRIKEISCVLTAFVIPPQDVKNIENILL